MRERLLPGTRPPPTIGHGRPSFGGVSGGGTGAWRCLSNVDTHRGCVDPHTHPYTHTLTCTRMGTLILSLRRSCWNLSGLHPCSGPGHYPPHLDKSQDLNLIKSSHTCPSSGSTYIVKTCQWIPSFGNKDQIPCHSLRGPLCPALETSLCPPQSPQWSHTGPYSVLLSFPLHRTLQVLCPRLESSFLPTPPLPR